MYQIVCLGFILLSPYGVKLIHLIKVSVCC